MKWCEILHEKLETANKKEDIQEIFNETAKEIMNSYILNIDNLKIELTEIEFYYFNCNTHDDHYVHIDKLQKNTCSFLYVHRKNYPRGGIDITFGNEKFYGGILIRGIKIDDKFISGSATIKKYIMEEISQEINDHKSLQEYFTIYKKNIYLHKRRNNRNNSYKIYSSTRVGLNQEIDENFYNKKYRFLREDYLKGEKEKFIGYSNIKEKTKVNEIKDNKSLERNRK